MQELPHVHGLAKGRSRRTANTDSFFERFLMCWPERYRPRFGIHCCSIRQLRMATFKWSKTSKLVALQEYEVGHLTLPIRQKVWFISYQQYGQKHCVLVCFCTASYLSSAGFLLYTSSGCNDEFSGIDWLISASRAWIRAHFASSSVCRLSKVVFEGSDCSIVLSKTAKQQRNRTSDFSAFAPSPALRRTSHLTVDSLSLQRRRATSKSFSSLSGPAVAVAARDDCC